ncbi:DMT family transporter [Falsiroseomonas sp.]|uniref:DMT family transporter n=1 Tax=Falsiroseomonas sp. TaxID=2870721 RepID=UPI00356B2566
MARRGQLSQPAAPDAARERRLGYACAVAVLFVWTGFLVFSRLSAQQALTPWDMGALRFTCSFLVALPLVAIFGLPRLKLRQVAAIGAFASFGFPMFAFNGFAFAPAAHGGVLMPGMLPFMTAALAVPLLHEAWTRRRLLSLGVVAFGIALLALDTFGSHPGAWRGDLLFLCAALSWSSYAVLARRWRIPAMDATIAMALIPAPLYLPVWWAFLPSNLDAVPAGVIAFHSLFQGTMATVLSAFLFTRAVAAIGPTRTTTVTSLTPAMGALLAWPLLGEALGAVGIAGVALVSVGMILGVLGRAAR